MNGMQNCCPALRRRRGASCRWRPGYFASALTLGLLVLTATSIATLAQGPAESVRSVTEITIAEKFSLSVSKELLKRLPTLAELPDHLREVLLAKDLTATIAGPKGPYEAPNDDELTFADLGGFDAIADRIRIGYPGWKNPLVVLSVAERGAKLIAAVYVFSANDRDGGGLKRIGRDVVNTAETDDKTIKQEWSVCFAEAIRRFVDKEWQDTDTECPRSGSQGATSRPVQGKAASAPAPAGPRADSSKVATVSPNSKGKLDGQPNEPAKGMLDDIPENRGKTVIITPEEGKVPVTITTPGAPPKAVSPVRPAPLPPPKPSPPGAPPVQSAKASPIGDASIRKSLGGNGGFSADVQLLEEVLGYGFVWWPNDEVRIKDVLQQMLTRQDPVGECLRDQQTRMNTEGLEKLLLADLRSGAYSPFLSINETKSGDFAIHVAAPDHDIRSPARCMRQKAPLRFHVLFPFEDGKYHLPETRRFVVEQRKAQPRKGWRLPRPIEGFAIASSLSRYSSRVDMNFWTELNGQPGILSVRVKDAGAVRNIELVNYEAVDPTKPRSVTTVAVIHDQ